MLTVRSDTVRDLSSIQDKVNYSEDFTITQEQVKQLKKYAGRYKKPQVNIHYIHDEAVTLFKDKPTIMKGKIERTNNKITMAGWENAVVYEVYAGDKLVFVSPSDTFEIPAEITDPVIRAVPAKGKPTVIKGNK